MCDADEKNRGFPILWVNTEFEKVTGYSCSELEGERFAIMQKQQGVTRPMKSEPDSIKHFSVALREGVPTRVRITNFRKDGRPWVNLMVIKPIFFGDKPRYVVGMQFDITTAGAFGKFALLNELMTAIPDVIQPDFRAIRSVVLTT
jgi:PAS domain S-box-containing protein